MYIPKKLCITQEQGNESELRTLMLRKGHYDLASCLSDVWGPHQTNPAAVNPMYWKGKEEQKWQNMGNHIKASLAFSPNEDLVFWRKKNIRKLILYQSQTVLTAPQPTFHLIGATALLWSWSGTRNWQEPWRRRTRLLEGLMTRIHVLKHHAVLRKMPCLGKMSIPRM